MRKSFIRFFRSFGQVCKSCLILMLIILNSSVAAAQRSKLIFFDDFNSSCVNSQNWVIPFWVSPNDGTFIGRTQFRCSQDSGLPSSYDSQAEIKLDSYNPTGYSFYGTDLISKRSFLPGKGLVFTIFAKIKTPVSCGIVGGIYLYGQSSPEAVLHDEIDFELLTNNTDKVHTNIYNNEVIGAGHPDSVVVNKPFTDYHMYTIKWLSSGVVWMVDGKTIRVSSRAPAGPMHFNLNLWVPAIEWKDAYDASLQPAIHSSYNQSFSMLVDWVKIDSLVDVATSVADIRNDDITFYPNPAKTEIHFSSPEKLEVAIYSSTGTLLTRKKNVTGVLNISELASGIYILVYERNGLRITRKLVVE
jgi:beta-glucanase (GH16 family)